jgi:tyrosinase
MALTLEFAVNGKTDASGRYVAWAPAPCRLRVLDADGATTPIAVRVRTKPGAGGKLVFRLQAAGAPSDELNLSLSATGAPKSFFVSGRFGSPSRADLDAVVEVRPAAATQVIATFPMMVRIRKDAEKLSVAERGRFLSALALLNNQGAGVFRDFRSTHTDDTSDEAHGLDGFMPWHRAYLLDLERELQKLDPSVALPYWRFDKPSPKLFSATFLGAPDPSGQAIFSPTNPLQLWISDGQLGIARRPRFDPKTSGASNPNGPVTAEIVTVGSTVGYGALRPVFEGNPHGRAHTSFMGLISQIGSAARDPLFFLLHCNVDRLWAKWQWLQRRFDATQANTFQFRGSSTSPGATRIGHNALDSMWPWNNLTGGLRPLTAPRQPFPAAPTTTAPGLKPTIRAMIDFQGQANVARRLGFDYDDVPFEAPV